jgi:DNA-binding IclR family transcriptional regulator
MLTAVAQYPDGAARDQLSILTGYKRSTRDAYLQRLGDRGFVHVNGSGITATQAGVDALGTDFEPLPTGSALLDWWLQRLPAGERAVLDVLAGAHPDGVDRAAIDERTGFKRSTRDAYIQRLMARRLVETDRGAVRASDELFD